MGGDMKGNATTLANKAEGNVTLETLVNGETDNKNEKELKKISSDGKTAACALLWLVRALNFILKLLDVLMSTDKKLSDCVMAGYEVSLKPHHGMVIKATFSGAVKMAPKREDFIKKLGPSEQEVFDALAAKLPVVKGLVDSMQEPKS